MKPAMPPERWDSLSSAERAALEVEYRAAQHVSAVTVNPSYMLAPCIDCGTPTRNHRLCDRCFCIVKLG
jgi:hypothetical protein